MTNFTTNDMSVTDAARGSKLGFVTLATAGTLWGTSFVFAKWVQRDISVGHMVLLRFILASLALAPALWLEHRRAPIHIARQDWPLFLWAALLGVPVQFLVQFGGSREPRFRTRR
jgi:drug/metabolite transporter (DMT)-like permease